MFQNSRKGQATVFAWLIYPVLALFVLALFSIIGYALFLEFKSEYVASGFTSPTSNNILDQFGNAILFFDWIAVIVLVVLVVMTMYLMHRTTQKPILFLAGFFLSPFIGFTAYIYNYMFKVFISDEHLFLIAQLFPKLTLIATNLHWIFFALLLLGLISMFTKSSNTDRGSLQT